jgi:YidC/Oxa1 family membrane protein insertase
MISYIFNTFFYTPLYNGLIFFISILPWHSAGLSIILFTCLVKILLIPLSQKAIKTQLGMRGIEGELGEIRAQYKDDRKIQAEKTLELYRKKGINPFSGIFLMLLQLPVLIALYFVFLQGGLPDIKDEILYSFTRIPDFIDMYFLGTNIAEKSTFYALLAAISQFLQMKVVMPKLEKRKTDLSQKPDFKDELTRSMNMQMKYVMPIIIFIIARSFPVVVALYLIVSSLFAVGQELYVRKYHMPSTSK